MIKNDDNSNEYIKTQFTIQFCEYDEDTNPHCLIDKRNTEYYMELYDDVFENFFSSIYFQMNHLGESHDFNY